MPKGASEVQVAVHSKRSENVELLKPIQAYIRAVYGERAAEDAAEDLLMIEALRSEVFAVEEGGRVPLGGLMNVGSCNKLRHIERSRGGLEFRFT
jgi:hypothetical protein